MKLKKGLSKEHLRDSTLEKLMNGEDLSDLDLSKSKNNSPSKI